MAFTIDPSSVPFPDSRCHGCVHVRIVRTKRGSAFVQCSEPTLPRYQSQPIVSCARFEPSVDRAD